MPDASDIAASPGAPNATPAYQARLAAYYAQCGAPRYYYDLKTGEPVTDPNHPIDRPPQETAFLNSLPPGTDIVSALMNMNRPTIQGSVQPTQAQILASTTAPPASAAPAGSTPRNTGVTGALTGFTIPAFFTNTPIAGIPNWFWIVGAVGLGLYFKGGR